MARDGLAYWATAPGTGELRKVALPEPGADEVLIAARWSGISRGTESLVARGAVPASQYGAMRCPFQDGEFPFPVKYGYASVGRVVTGPAALEGRDVFCLFPHQDRYVVPASAVQPLPNALPPARAVLAANMETALNVIWDAAVLPGERIVVLGGGVVGCLIARLARRIPGTEVVLVDVDAAKGEVAAALEIPFRDDPSGLVGVDCVVNASASGEALAAALVMAGDEARIVEASWHGDRTIALPLGEAFHSRRLRILSSQVGHIPPSQLPRWDHRRRLAKALELLLDPGLDRLISGESSFAELPRVMAELSRSRSGVLCHRIRYD